MLTIKLIPGRDRPEIEDKDLLAQPFETWSPEDLYKAARGRWRLGPAAEKERYALVHATTVEGSNRVLALIEIKGWDPPQEDGRRAFIGTPLPRSHGLATHFLDQPTPVGEKSQNPVAYYKDKMLGVAQYTDCACGCEVPTPKTWRPGHDQKAIHNRIADHFGGDTLSFIRWFDWLTERGDLPAIDESTAEPEPGNDDVK